MVTEAPAPPPPPPAAPPPPPPVKTFIVFFDFNKSNLTAEAQAVVSEAVKTAKQQGAVRILVTGHTDTVGSHSYNQGLSEHRAASVKEEMVREGLGADQIATEGKSFDDPLVPTGPGVREPQNRRAVIDLGGGG
jgi:outer membrane protein OmpA-like peptidoglycan-associated protein